MAARAILVACTANMCRSPMAEGLLRERLRREGLASRVSVTSAGTWAVAGLAATEHAVVCLAEMGADISQHVSREVGAEDVAAADLILVMTSDHRAALEAEFPDARGKTFLMSALSGGSWDIADPVGGSLEDYRATASELARLVDAGWDIIVGRSAMVVEETPG